MAEVMTECAFIDAALIGISENRPVWQRPFSIPHPKDPDFTKKKRVFAKTAAGVLLESPVSPAKNKQVLVKESRSY